MTKPTSETTGHPVPLLERSGVGPANPAAELFSNVYAELHRLAERYMDGERDDHTLQPTALLHEAYVKLATKRNAVWKSREQFLGTAAQAMRCVLVDHARARATCKRGGRRVKVLLDEALSLYEERVVDMLALHAALERLAEIDLQLAKIVELRFFANMTTEETAAALQVAPRTVSRGWSTARAWLRQNMGAHDDT